MTKTKDKPRTVETVEAELEDLRGRVTELRAELRRAQEVPEISWDGVSPESLEELAESEKRRLVLPHHIRAGEIKEQELIAELSGLRMPAADAEIANLHDALQAATETARKAEEERRAAEGALGVGHQRRRDLLVEKRQAERTLEDLKAAAQRGREVLAAPVVRSLWQTGR